MSDSTPYRNVALAFHTIFADAELPPNEQSLHETLRRSKGIRGRRAVDLLSATRDGATVSAATTDLVVDAFVPRHDTEILRGLRARTDLKPEIERLVQKFIPSERRLSKSSPNWTALSALPKDLRPEVEALRSRTVYRAWLALGAEFEIRWMLSRPSWWPANAVRLASILWGDHAMAHAAFGPASVFTCAGHGLLTIEWAELKAAGDLAAKLEAAQLVPGEYGLYSAEILSSECASKMTSLLFGSRAFVDAYGLLREAVKGLAQSP